MKKIQVGHREQEVFELPLSNTVIITDNTCFGIKTKAKVKVALEKTMKTLRGSRGIALFFL